MTRSWAIGGEAQTVGPVGGLGPRSPREPGHVGGVCHPRRTRKDPRWSQPSCLLVLPVAPRGTEVWLGGAWPGEQRCGGGGVDGTLQVGLGTLSQLCG